MSKNKCRELMVMTMVRPTKRNMIMVSKPDLTLT